MLAVAVIGLLLAAAISGVGMSRRASNYRQKAAALGRMEREARKQEQERLHLAESLDRQAESRARTPQFQEGARDAAKLAAYHRRLAARRGHEADGYAGLRNKYERAAGRPWLPVEPDPPPRE
jgi:hypothetical protein